MRGQWGDIVNLDFRAEKLMEGARTFERAAHHNGRVCGEGRYAEPFAEQPRAACVAIGRDGARGTVAVTRPACRMFAERPANDTAMAQYLAAAASGPAIDLPYAV
ncbi:MAG TPA: hypothetical protein VFD50_11375 [Thermoleophilia bacterium]|nr:hypothetical protein [Thermoleophilia bacterium]